MGIIFLHCCCNKGLMRSMEETSFNYRQFEKRYISNTISAYLQDLGQYVDFSPNTFPEYTTEIIDFSLIRAWINPLKRLQANLGKCTVKIFGKRNRERVIPFLQKIVFTIKGYLKIRNRGVIASNYGSLLVTEKGKMLYPMICLTVNKYLREFTISKKYNPHILRDRHAIHLLSKGSKINAVKDTAVWRQAKFIPMTRWRN